MELLRFLEESWPKKFADVFADEESSFYLDHPRASKWFPFGVPRPTRVGRNIEARKDMLWICLSMSGNYDVVIASPGERINRDFLRMKC
jgi:hypothetical protein